MPFKTNLIAFSHPCLDLVFIPSKTPSAFIFLPRATCPAHPTRFSLITQVIFDDNYNHKAPVFCYFVPCRVWVFSLAMY